MSKPDINKTARTMVQYYQRAFNEIIGQIQQARQGDNYWRVAKQAHLLKQIGEILDRYNSKSYKYLEKALKAVADYETRLAIGDLEDFRDSLKHAQAWHLEYNEKQAAQACADSYQHIAGQTQRMRETVKRQLRQDSADIFRLAAVKGTTRRKAFRELRDKILTKSPGFQFIDKAGKKWDSRVYLDMLTHTIMSQAQNDTYANTLVNEGIDLARISHSGATDACKKWEGRVISLTGATPGYPTLQEAKATSEIFHPRCRHRFMAYDPDIEEIFKKEKAA